MGSVSALRACHNIMDVRDLAKRRLPHPIFEFLEGGSETEFTLRRNTAAFDDFQLIARCLVNVESIDTTARILGQSTALPLICSPTGASKVFHPEGELAVARAAARAGVLYGLATASTFCLEDVAAVGRGPKMFLLYPYKDRSIMWELMDRARAAGYSSLCLMVDVPVKGKRERDLRTGFNMAPSFSLALSAMRRPAWAFGQLCGGPVTLANFSRAGAGAISQLDAAITWKDIGEIVHRWAGPFAFKGIMSAEDAIRAADAGATAIFVSNHGGRQLDGAAAPLDVLPEIVAAVGRRIEVILDGGIRRGVHILKALALGATACSVGRPYLYGLSAAGEAGVLRTLEILRAEFETAMKLVGCPDIASIDASMIRRLGAHSTEQADVESPHHNRLRARSL